MTNRRTEGDPAKSRIAPETTDKASDLTGSVDPALLREALDTLRLVVEKADKLERLRFTEHLRSGGSIGFSGSRSETGFNIAYNGPDEEAIDAFVLTYRFFIQNNERSSLANIEGLFTRLPLDRRRIDAVIGTRKSVNDFLDSSTGVVVNGQQLKRRTLIDTFLYGDFAHGKPKHKALMDQWVATGGRPVFQSIFVATISEVLNAIFWFRQACREAAEILESQS
jgi:hypothetical protein